jgi:hypothetical protein
VPEHDPLFDSAWIKWSQAVLHSQTLEREIAARADDPVRAFRTEYQSQRHGFAVIVDEIDAVPVRWQLLLGEVANNYRTALDHLAWALVRRGRTPPDMLTARQQRGVYFPIFEDRGQFNQALARYLPGVRRADATKVRWCQPFRRAARNRSRDPLVLLSRITSGDKHRTIQPLWEYPSRVDLEVTDIHDSELRETQHWRRHATALEIGTEIAFMRCRKLGPDPQLELTITVASTPTIGNRISLRNWHQATGVFIFSLLRQFSGQPASIHDIGAELVPLPPVSG